MKKSSYGGIVVIFIICVLAICCGTVAGSLHIGEDYSKELIPTSVSTPVDTISIIDEKDFQAKNITVKLYIPKPVVKKPVVKNDTNSTNQTTNKSSDNYNVSQKSKNKNYTNKKSYN
ncbi:MAG: hypothetical protein BZ135_08310 [Methanosphaera sp. rholeuAM6]|nr:MAG: hypothetical protein BZ135_08310 [Methanosphaera sp. rholeuAM6]